MVFVPRYYILFTKAGIVKEERGERPPYIDHFISNMSIVSSPVTVSVRSDVLTYGMDIKNVYLLVYGDRAHEEEAVAEIERRMHRDEEEEGEDIRDERKEEKEEEEEEREVVQEKSKERSSFFSLFRKKYSLEEAEEKLNAHFISKNIPVELSKRLSKEVALRAKEDAEGTQDERLHRATVKAVESLLATTDPLEIIKEIRRRKTQNKGPYVFCMIGVNGVGKSTTLSKLCLWLLRQDLSLCVSACDSFRSGAIEQLKRHVARYKQRGYHIDLFEKGYGKDESSIAKGSIDFARENGYDVVLIDTSGRMHTNKHLMTSLSKLIRVNRPDQVVYVGEALVGNDSSSQIRTFNSYVEGSGVDKGIDGIIVTKCDTVDDKVGTILSLSHAIAKPVLFVGMGQANADLLPFNVQNLTSLISSYSP